MVRFVVKRYAPRTFDYQWAVIDTEENKRIGRYKTKNLAESACFNLNKYGFDYSYLPSKRLIHIGSPEAEQFFKDGIVDRNKINKPDHRKDDTLPKPKRHSNKRLISLN